MQEEFRKITGFEKYSVSNFGNIRIDESGLIRKLKLKHTGYYEVNLSKDGKKTFYLVHRLVALMFIPNPENKPFVDHIDNNKLNNHVSNLRWANGKDNNRNRSLAKNNNSGVKGVNWDKRINKWRARICVNYKNIELGHFDNLEDAKRARQKRAKELFGDFLNDCEKPQEIEVNLNIKKTRKQKIKLNINIINEDEDEYKLLEEEFERLINN